MNAVDIFFLELTETTYTPEEMELLNPVDSQLKPAREVPETFLEIGLLFSKVNIFDEEVL